MILPTFIPPYLFSQTLANKTAGLKHKWDKQVLREEKQNRTDNSNNKKVSWAWAEFILKSSTLSKQIKSLLKLKVETPDGKAFTFH